MKYPLAGIIIGGLIPALFFGFSGLFQKLATRAGISLGIYVMTLGAAVVVTGAVIWFFLPQHEFNARALSFAAITGSCWSLGMVGLAIGIARHNVPASVLIPLANMNTLVGVLLVMIVFSEWRDVNLVKLLTGALLITAGGVIVSRA